MPRPLSDLPCSRIVLGLWPLAGVTTMGVTPSDAQETMEAAIESGVVAFDTAFSYGYDGESDRLLGQYVQRDPDHYTVIGKVGQRWTSDRKRVIDGRPATLVADAETSLRRLGIDRFDLLMLHSPDPEVALEQSAEAIAKLKDRGLCRRIGVCNVDAGQQASFASAVGCQAIECPLNLLQRDALKRLIPQCVGTHCDVYVFWSLMKGLLAGRISRDHVFAEGDSRPKYDIYQGEARERAHDVLDVLQRLAEDSGVTVAQLSIGWTMTQPGVTAAIVGAHRAEQVREIAAAKPLAPEIAEAIDKAVGATGLC